MNEGEELRVTSHVGRDLLAAAALFKTEASVVWEYVANSLQYVKPGTTPHVYVIVQPRKKRIEVHDNGRGMSAADLKDFFFKMHGENPDRLGGRPGRGKFGTGKSAAFGIARTLVVDTRSAGRRNVVALQRKVIEESGGEDVPLEWRVRDEPTKKSDGTSIYIQDIFVKKIRTPAIIDYIERHLQAFRAGSPEVAVNSHICEYQEPEFSDEQKFEPNTKQREVLGNVALTIQVARAPLPDMQQGVAVTAGAGNLVAIEHVGVQTKEFGSYLTGRIDVPALESSDSPVAPYDSTRSLQLNPEHPVVRVLLGFLGANLEKVRSELARKARVARQSEQHRRLTTAADEIADLLNRDFQSVKNRLRAIHAASAHPGTAQAKFGGPVAAGEDEDVWVRGTAQPGVVAQTPDSRTVGGGRGRPDPEIIASGEADERGPDAVDPAGGSGKRLRRPRGGFRVEYRALGKEANRSVYDTANLTILINLDHVVVRAALGEGKVEDPGFRRLSYEIAFSEYAMGLGYEILKQDPNLPADDLLYEVRTSLNRIASAAAPLYRD